MNNRHQEKSRTVGAAEKPKQESDEQTLKVYIQNDSVTQISRKNFRRVIYLTSTTKVQL